MRIYDLFESPIGHLEVHGMDAAGSFPDADRKLLQNPAHIKKIRQHFAYTDVNFNFYFVNQKGAKYTDGNRFSADWYQMLKTVAGTTDSAIIKRHFGVTIPPDPSAITVVFLSNANVSNSIPMTPWIIAHRFAHALTDQPEILPLPLHRLVFSIPHAIELEDGEVSTGRVMTTRSARSGMLNDGEETEELIAQFLIRGNVTLELADAADNPHAEANTAHLRQAAQRIDTIIAAILQNCVGKMFLAI